MPWRSHQRDLLALARDIAAGRSQARDILAAVTPGGGKSALPVLLAAHLLPAGLAARVCWIVPRDSLRLQAEEAFADPRFRDALGHALRLRAAGPTDPEPWRGAEGWATTYQAVAADPRRHLAQLRQAGPVLLVLDEAHHLPEPADRAPAQGGSEGSSGGGADAEGAGWAAAIAPLLGAAAFRLFLTGTLERADGRRILGLPYAAPGGPSGGPLGGPLGGPSGGASGAVDTAAPGWAVLGYSRRRALAERAVLPVRFGALDGEASWLGPPGGDRPRSAPHFPSGPAAKMEHGPHRLAAPRAGRHTRPALFAALRTGFARELLARALAETRALRAARRAGGLALPGKLLVVAADQDAARQALGWLRAGLGRRHAHLAALAISGDGPRGTAALARFRRGPEPACLVTVAMAYEGLDAPEVAVLAALTHVRSTPWLEQMVARATRVDPGAGPWEAQRAVVFHPDDPLFAGFRARLEREQGAAPWPIPLERCPLGRSLQAGPAGEAPAAIVPLSSRALGAPRWAEWRPGPAAPRGLGEAPAPFPCLPAPGFPCVEDADPAAPSRRETALRRRLAALVAAQAAEDAAEGHLRGPAGAAPGRGGGLLFAYNAALKRVLGGRPRKALAAAELDAACAWLATNRLSGELFRLAGDGRFAWLTRRVDATVSRGPDFTVP